LVVSTYDGALSFRENNLAVREKLVARIIELSGGVEQLKLKSDRSLEDINSKWLQHTEVTGRVLRAHLFVEHFMTNYLQSGVSALSSKKVDRLTFSQKLDLVVKTNDSQPQEILTGVKCLNRIRNQIAHNLSVELTPSLIDDIAAINSFMALRAELAKPCQPCADPISIIEDFAKHAGVIFDSIADPNSLSKLFSLALTEQQSVEG
jgi:hypothetical protein